MKTLYYTALEDGLSLRPYQMEVFDRMGELENERFLVILPTAGGKTRNAMSWVMQNAWGNGNNKKVIWVARSQELLQQAMFTLNYMGYKEYSEEESNYENKFKIHCKGGTTKYEQQDYQDYSDGNFQPYEYIMKKEIRMMKSFDVYIGQNKLDEADKIEDYNSDIDILFITEKMLGNRLEYIIPKIEKSNIILIIDEAHHTGADTYSSIIEKIDYGTASQGQMTLIGLTATPFRTEKSYSNNSETEKLLKLFNNEKIEPVRMVELMQYGYLAKPNFISAPDLEEDENSYLQIAKYYQGNKKEWGKTLLFASNIEIANEIYQGFKESGIRVGCFYGRCFQISDGVEDRWLGRAGVLKKFESELEVLINVEMLCEGYDLPQIKSVFLVSASGSTIRTTQMVGRGLRVADDKEQCNIVNFTVDNIANRVYGLPNVEDIQSYFEIETIKYQLENGTNMDYFISHKEINDYLAVYQKGKEPDYTDFKNRENLSEMIREKIVNYHQAIQCYWKTANNYSFQEIRSYNEVIMQEVLKSNLTHTNLKLKEIIEGNKQYIISKILDNLKINKGSSNNCYSENETDFFKQLTLPEEQYIELDAKISVKVKDLNKIYAAIYNKQSLENLRDLKIEDYNKSLARITPEGKEKFIEGFFKYIIQNKYTQNELDFFSEILDIDTGVKRQ